MSTSDTPLEFRTVQQAAEALQVAPASVYRAVRRGDLAAVRIGRAIRIPTSELGGSATSKTRSQA